MKLRQYVRKYFMNGIGRGMRRNENWIVNHKTEVGSLELFSVLEGSNMNTLQFHGAFFLIIIYNNT